MLKYDPKHGLLLRMWPTQLPGGIWTEMHLWHISKSRKAVAVVLTVCTCVCRSEDVSAAGSKTPTKFYVPHVSVSFGPGGQLVCVCPSAPSEGQTALVELHSMEVNESACPWRASMLLPASSGLSLGVSRNGGPCRELGRAPCGSGCMCRKGPGSSLKK